MKEVRDVTLWEMENPYLYEVDYILYEDGEDTVMADRRKLMFGFRTVEITGYNPETNRGPFIMLNGKPLKIRGVNRHEFDPEHGRYVSREFNENDIILCRKTTSRQSARATIPTVATFTNFATNTASS